MTGKRLRDWNVKSYNDEGRYNTTSDKAQKNSNSDKPGHGNGMKEKGGPDKGRRNK